MVLVERLRKEEYLPVQQRPTSQAKLYYIKVMFSFFRSTIAAGVQFSCYCYYYECYLQTVFVLSLQLVEQVFSWFNSQDPKTWNSHMQEFPRYEHSSSYF